MNPNPSNPISISRRQLLQGAGALGAYAALSRLSPAWAQNGLTTERSIVRPSSDGALDLTITQTPFVVDGRTGSAIMVNGSVPGPILRLREGQDAVIRVTNLLNEITSIHWHGLIVPPDMDGVPGVAFSGIRPGTTFTYRFPVRQSGTYWGHSHSGGQELMGHYFPILIEPKEPEPFAYDRELVVLLSDWSFLSPATMMAKLKKSGGYFNLQRRTLGEFFSDVSKNGFKATLDERSMWAKMRMDPTDFADVTGVAYTYLVNGMSPDANWTGLFTPGEKVRLRFINSCAMTIMTVRIPGLKMKVVQVDGQNVVPVEADEFRIAPAETYDMIVEPEDRAYTIFSENLGRSGYARATLAPKLGMSAPVPEMRPRPIRTMADMGMEMSAMGGMKSMDMGAKASEVSHTMPDGSVMAGAMKPGVPDMGRSQGMEGSGMKMGDMTGPTNEVGGMAIPGVRVLAPDGSHYMPPGMEMPAMKTRGMKGMDMRGAPMPDKSKMPAMPGMTTTSNPPMAMDGMKMDGMVPALPPGTLDTRVYMHGPDGHGVGSAGLPMSVRNRMGEPGIGLEETGTKVLVYTDLKRLEPTEDMRVPTREVELHITGNMERYMWGFDGKKYSEAGAL